jgi:cytochrome d ubiquinol oxidase subunit II
MAMEMILPDLWFALIGLVLFLAVALDGFDLGVGILSLLTRDEERRSLLMGSIGPVWHANLTWLVVAGGLFFGVFPRAYGVIFSALYIPVIVMLFGLIFRGVAFDFREEARSKTSWNLAFGLGSLVAALAQGCVVGGFLSGIKMAGQEFAGGVWDWLNPFAALIALGLVFGYVLLGATYLIAKTAGEIHQDSYRHAQAAAWSLLLLAVGVGWWAIFKVPYLTGKWFTWPGLWLTSCPMALAGLAFALLIYSLLRLYDRAPFVWTLLLFLGVFFAMAASLHPYVIPPTVTLGEAASPTLTLVVMLIVVGIMLPIMFIYNGYQYRIFRGKVTAGGYGGD